MKQKVKQKLNSHSGVSVLLALVGFIVAVMVSMVIVTAAISSAQTVMNDRKTNQTHLTLESAAQLVRDEMENTVCTYKVNEVSGKSEPCCSGTFSAITEAAVNYADFISIDDYDSSAHGTDFTISLQDRNGKSAGVKDVDVTFIMKSSEDEKYDICFTLSTTDDSGSTQTVYLSMNGKPDEKSDGTKTITWKGISISQVDQKY